MAIAIRGTSGTPNFAVNSVTPTIPTAQVTGDMMLLLAAGKPFDAGWSVATAGWNALGSGASGSTAAGIDVGSMKAQVWYKEATSDTETNPTLTEGTPTWNVIGAHIIVLSKGAGESWETPVVVYGADEVSGTAVSVTYASDPGVTAGDHIIQFLGSNSDALGPLTANLTPAQTGATFGTTTERGESESTSGGDMTFHSVDTPVSSGTGSAAPTATATGTASGGADRLEAGFVRLRVAQAVNLVVEDAAHAHAADNVVLVPDLIVQDALHAHTVDNIVLVQQNTLVVQDALHSHAADNVVLDTGVANLVVQEALHTHTADNVALVMDLIVQDALHTHTADNLELVQQSTLAVADALHAHEADNVVLSAQGAGPEIDVLETGAYGNDWHTLGSVMWPQAAGEVYQCSLEVTVSKPRGESYRPNLRVQVVQEDGLIRVDYTFLVRQGGGIGDGDAFSLDKRWDYIKNVHDDDVTSSAEIRCRAEGPPSDALVTWSARFVGILLA